MRKNIKIAAIQMHSKKGEFELNRRKAEKYIIQSAERGADLVLLPELFSCGYVPNKETWNFSECSGGSTEMFLKEMSEKYDICIGAGLLEKKNGHYFNGYLVTNSKGEVICNAIKNNAESYVFKGTNYLNVFETEFGRIGIGVCADNHYTDFIQRMQRERINILLMPHALPMPYGESTAIKKSDVEKLRADVIVFPKLISDILGIPVVFINQIGEFYPMAGIFGKLLNPEVYRIGGYSKIVSESGKVLDEIADEEGVIVGEVNLTSTSNELRKVPNYQGWVQEGSFLLRRIILPLDVFMGKIYYMFRRR